MVRILTHLYLERSRRVLLSGLSRTRLLYLDTNYWVRLRDAELGCGTPEAARLLQTLRAMVRSREVLCVTHFHSFLEVGKQEETSLRVTASLLDELTEAVAVASRADLLVLECADFIEARLGLQLQHDLCVWTKVGQIHKQDLPNQMPGPATLFDTNVILKALIDTLWNASFDDVFGSFKWETKSRLNVDIDQEVLEQVEERRRAKDKSLSRSSSTVRVCGRVWAASANLADLLNKWHIQHRFPKGLKAVLNHPQ